MIVLTFISSSNPLFVNVMLVYDNSIVLNKEVCVMTELVCIIVKYTVCSLSIQNILFHVVLSVIPPKTFVLSFGQFLPTPAQEGRLCVCNFHTKKKGVQKNR